MVCDSSSYPIVVCLFNVLDIILYHFVSSGECLIHLIVRRKTVPREKRKMKKKQSYPMSFSSLVIFFAIFALQLITVYITIFSSEPIDPFLYNY